MALNEGIAQAVIQALGSGDTFHSIGPDEGTIDFWTGEQHHEDVTLVSGADGTTNYVQVTATWTATEDTTVTALFLWGTKSSRTDKIKFSSQTPIIPSQVLLEGQTYTVNWTLHAEI